MSHRFLPIAVIAIACVGCARQPVQQAPTSASAPVSQSAIEARNRLQLQLQTPKIRMKLNPAVSVSLFEDSRNGRNPVTAAVPMGRAVQIVNAPRGEGRLKGALAINIQVPGAVTDGGLPPEIQGIYLAENDRKDEAVMFALGEIGRCGVGITHVVHLTTRESFPPRGQGIDDSSGFSNLNALREVVQINGQPLYPGLVRTIAPDHYAQLEGGQLFLPLDVTVPQGLINREKTRLQGGNAIIYWADQVCEAVSEDALEALRQDLVIG